MTGLYWRMLRNCRAHANIHIIVIRCIFNCCFECFHTAVSLCCLFHYGAQLYIYILVQTPLCSFRFVRQHLLSCSEALTSLELHPGGLTLQRHAGQPVVLQALTLGHMRSNDYSTTKIFVFFFYCLRCR